VKEILKLIHFWRSYRQKGLIASRAICHQSPVGVMSIVSKYEAKGHGLGLGIDGHAGGRHIQRDDAVFYRITSISSSETP